MGTRLNYRDILRRYGPEAATYAILTSTLGSSKLQPEVADRYIQEVIENTVVINAARRLPMTSDKRNIDRLTHTGRVVKKATEGVAPTLAGAVGFAQRQLSAVELIAAEDWSFTTIEDNIEGEQLEDTLVSVMARLAARDIEELFLYANADDVATPAWPDAAEAGDAYREILGHDGWLLLSNNLIDKQGAQPATVKDLFIELIDSIPSKIFDSIPRTDWRFYVSSKLERAYREEIGERSTNLGDRALFENVPVSFDGIPVQSVPMLRNETRDMVGGGNADVTNVTDCMLVVPENLVSGFRREVDADIERKPRTRTFELTITARGDCNCEDPDAYASMINVKVPGT